jgi:hypothetical protein
MKNWKEEIKANGEGMGVEGTGMGQKWEREREKIRYAKDWIRK